MNEMLNETHQKRQSRSRWLSELQSERKPPVTFYLISGLVNCKYCMATCRLSGPGRPIKKTSWPKRSFCMIHFRCCKVSAGMSWSSLGKYLLGTSSGFLAAWTGLVTSPMDMKEDLSRSFPRTDEVENEVVLHLTDLANNLCKTHSRLSIIDDSPTMFWLLTIS